jgi:hypothetical protein
MNQCKAPRPAARGTGSRPVDRASGETVPSKRRPVRRAALAAAAACAIWAGVTAPAARAAQFYASHVEHAAVGNPAQSGFGNVAQALGAPSGRGGGATASEGSTSVYNLGVGGSLTLGFDDVVNGARTTSRAIVDDPGADFIVFENAFYAGGRPATTFAELVFVEVSSNSTDYARFPYDSRTGGAVQPFGTINAADVSGFAGVTPVFANPSTNTVDPFDPTVAGGDAFDLAALAGHALVGQGKLDLDAVRFVRLVDVIGDGRHLNADGTRVYDPTGAGSGGADIDALAVIHGAVVPEPARAALLLVAAAAGVLAPRRRHRRKEVGLSRFKSP